MEKGPGAAEPRPVTEPKPEPEPKLEPGPEPEPELLVMDEPAKPRSKVYLVLIAVFISMCLIIGANASYLSELAKEDREPPAISAIKTRSDGYDQEVKLTVNDDRNLPIKVQIRLHFWNVSNDTVPKTKWSIDRTWNREVRPGATIVQTLPFLPNKADMWTEGWYTGWFVWVDATDYSGRTNSTERCVFPTQTDPDW